MLLVHRRVRAVPAKRRAEGVRRGAAVVDRRAQVLAVRQTGAQGIRSRGDRQLSVPDHRIPAHVFRGREFRRHQRKADVSHIT